VDPRLEHARGRVGESLRDKWTLERVLGVGGMASVYAAKHRNGLRGAVKMLHPELAATPDVKERFLREGYAANQIAHPGVVRVLDDDVAQDGSVFLVMELLEGQTVDALARTRPGYRLPMDQVLDIADMLLDVLAVAHDRGVIHRDIKPENLFWTTKGELRVLDFGIARLRELAGSASATQTGATMGTPAFMPPEQASGQWSFVDGRTDLWAVGATLFTLLTGRFVHEAPTVQLIYAAAMTQQARPIASVDPGVPPSVAAIVDRALAWNRDHRWPDARAMQHAVRAARAGSPVRAEAVVVPSAPWTAPARSAPEAVLPTLLATSPTNSPVSSGMLAPSPSPKASKAPIVIAAAAVAGVAIAAAGWLVLHRADPPVPVVASAATSDAPSAVAPGSAAEPASTAPSVVPAASAAPEAGASSSANPPAAPMPTAPARPLSRPASPSPTARPAHPGGPKHPGMY
jgi:serine/threonine-protein kinase